MKRYDEEHVSVLIPDGDLQGSRIADLEKTLKSLCEENINRTALDMSQVGYIYSKGIGVLVRNQKIFKERGGGIYLYNLTNSVQRILLEGNLTTYLNICSSKEEIDFELSAQSSIRDDSSLELGLNFKLITSGKGVRAVLEGTIDSEKDILTLKKGCETLLGTGSGAFEIDMADLVYMDDQAVHSLVEFARKLTPESGKITLFSPNDIILDQLEFMNALSYFEVLEAEGE